MKVNKTLNDSSVCPFRGTLKRFMCNPTTDIVYISYRVSRTLRLFSFQQGTRDSIPTHLCSTNNIAEVLVALCVCYFIHKFIFSNRFWIQRLSYEHWSLEGNCSLFIKRLLHIAYYYKFSEVSQVYGSLHMAQRAFV